MGVRGNIVRRPVIVALGAAIIAVIAVGVFLVNALVSADDGSQALRPGDRVTAFALAWPSSREALRASGSPPVTFSRPFTCDEVLTAEQTTVDGEEQAVPAGTIICLEAGTRPPLTIKSIQGRPDRPVVFVNLGRVTISGTHDDYAGITITDSAEIHITGAGGEDVACGAGIPVDEQDCGIVIHGTGRGIAGPGRTSGVTIDHVEITGTSHSGVHLTAKAGDGITRDSFVQERTRVHSSYLHDVGKEGLYLGSSFYQDGVDPVLTGVEVSHNLVVTSGWDGIQVGSAVADCAIRWNTVVLAGSRNTANQNSGIIANRGSVCDIDHNVVVSSAAQGIYVQGNGGNRIHHNLVVGAGIRDPGRGEGITIRTGSNTDGSVYVWHNTVVAAAGAGVLFRNEVGADNTISNNLVVSAGREPIDASARARVHSVGNVTVETIQGARFAAPYLGNFQPTETSPAVGSASPDEVREGVDLVGLPLPSGTDTAGALEPTTGQS